MPEIIPENSVGIVTPKIINFTQPIQLDCGQMINEYTLIYETYGKLNDQHDNAILICHALSGDQHVAGYHHQNDKKPGWWDSAIGPNKPIDTNKFFVVCCNNLGGCKGSTGPNTINPESNTPYGPDFPIVTVKDWVNSQQKLGLKLGIEKWKAVIGGSLGGMQALQWSIDFPEQIEHAIIIAAAAKLSAQNIAFNEVARQAILTDPHFHQGHYYKYNTLPRSGLMLARMLGHLTYLSEDAMRDKFGRELREGKLNFNFDIDFQVESYLRYQGQSFVNRFDANTYLLMTKALDYFDPAQNHNDNLAEAIQHVQAKFLLISFTSDWRFSSKRTKEIVNALIKANKIVTYADIDANHGHDAFLFPIEDYMNIFKSYLNNV